MNPRDLPDDIGAPLRAPYREPLARYATCPVCGYFREAFALREPVVSLATRRVFASGATLCPPCTTHALLAPVTMERIG